ncbi:MAG: aminotransferase class III-fold pyridoxal phosphate-dependent enzyme [Actinobacteria bacterium]|nr:aminotransferase class III-fold pyridoxal phosphate-dependent enzyme [Actinomycetota bacterium]
MSVIEAAYIARTPKSAAMGPRAQKVMPAGDTRAAGFHTPYPLTIASATGVTLTDIDGNEYLDLSNNFTSLLHGHAYQPIVDAVSRVIGTGTAWPARNNTQVELAELICERVPSIDLVRFCNSGSEANMLALHVARTHTGRHKVLMARFGYHGSHEAFEAGYFGNTGDKAWPHTIIAPWGDADAFETELEKHGDEIAAVFLEAAMGASGLVQASPEFFQRVIDATHRAGAVFVLDEVITLRLSTGGHQVNLGINPDLTTLGKIIGGGYPVGAVGGRADLMSLLDPTRGRIFHSGTFNGNPVTTAAGVVSFNHLTSDAVTRMGAQAERLERSLAESAAGVGLPFSCRRVGSLLNVYFSDVLPAASLAREDAETMRLVHLAGMNRGLYFASRGLLVLSTVMSDENLAEMCSRFDAVFADVAAEISS